MLAPTIESLLKIEERSLELEVRRNELEGKAGDKSLDDAEGRERASTEGTIFQPMAKPKEISDLFGRNQVEMLSPPTVEIGLNDSLFQRRTSLPQRRTISESGREARLISSALSSEFNGHSVSSQNFLRDRAQESSTKQDIETLKLGAEEPVLALPKTVSIKEDTDSAGHSNLIGLKSTRADDIKLLSQEPLTTNSDIKPTTDNFAASNKNSTSLPFKEKQNDNRGPAGDLLTQSLQIRDGGNLDCREAENKIKHGLGLQLPEKRLSIVKVPDSPMAASVNAGGGPVFCPFYLQGEKVSVQCKTWN